MTPTKSQSKAVFDAGYQAYEKDENLNSNPHKKHSGLWVAWNNGWKESRNDNRYNDSEGTAEQSDSDKKLTVKEAAKGTKIKVVKKSAAQLAYEEGYDAFDLRVARKNNPFKGSDINRQEQWNSGWVDSSEAKPQRTQEWWGEVMGSTIPVNHLLASEEDRPGNNIKEVPRSNHITIYTEVVVREDGTYHRLVVSGVQGPLADAGQPCFCLVSGHQYVLFNTSCDVNDTQIVHNRLYELTTDPQAGLVPFVDRHNTNT